MSNRLRGLTRNGKLERGFIKERYGKSKQLRFLNEHPLIPIGYVQTRDAQHKKKTVNRYTPEGRAEIHKNLGVNTDMVHYEGGVEVELRYFLGGVGIFTK